MSLVCELARLDALVQELPETLNWLSASEAQRLHGFSHPQRRSCYLAGRRLARLSLARWPGLNSPRLQIDDQGRSFVEGRPDLYLSISHSGPWAACAVSDAPIGVDIEDTDRCRDFLALAQIVHSPAQCRGIEAARSSAEQARLFYQWWTLKEARFKRQGQGLDMALMPQMEYQLKLSGAGAAASCYLPQLGLMLALDGLACERSALAASLPALAGAAPVWQLFDEAGAAAQSTPKSK